MEQISGKVTFVWISNYLNDLRKSSSESGVIQDER